jgi:hypothetical protein
VELAEVESRPECHLGFAPQADQLRSIPARQPIRPPRLGDRGHAVVEESISARSGKRSLGMAQRERREVLVGGLVDFLARLTPRRGNGRLQTRHRVATRANR